ncbi:hypothetical protein J3D48_006261 [Pseudomonas fluorescens]|nr:hypothetical protein [Pseudomonas fluorescens]
MATTAKTRPITTHVPVQLAERGDLMAERLERSKNWIVRLYRPGSTWQKSVVA